MDNNLKPITTLRPFTRFICGIGVLPTSYIMSMTYEEQLIWLCNYLKETVIPTINNNGLAIEELQNKYIEFKQNIEELIHELESYMNNYFENLDVQEEINNKLDEMVEDGTLENIIAQYLQLQATYTYNNVEEMQEATNLTSGCFTRTSGYSEYNDGKGAFYKVREKTISDVVDGFFIIQLYDDNLVAEYIKYDIQKTTTYNFDSVNDLQNSNNLFKDTYARTSGFYNYNDNGGAYYKIREITNSDVVDNMTILSLTNYDNLVAELIYGETININILGASPDNEYNDNYINKALEISNKVYIPEGIYKIQNPINIKTNQELFGIGKSKSTLRKDGVSYYNFTYTFTYDNVEVDYSDKDSIINIIPNGENQRECSNISIHDLSLITGASGSSVSSTKIGVFMPITSFSSIKNVRIMRCNNAINVTGWINIFENLEMLDCNYTIYTTLSIATLINKCHSNAGSYYLRNCTNLDINNTSADGGNPCFICWDSDSINLNSCSTETPFTCVRCENAYTYINGGDYLGFYQIGVTWLGFFVTQGDGKLYGEHLSIRYTGTSPDNKNIITNNNSFASISANIDVPYTYKNYKYGANAVNILNDTIESNRLNVFNKVKIETSNATNRFDILRLPISYGIGYSLFVKATGHYLQTHMTFQGCVNAIWGGASEDRVKVDMTSYANGDNNASLSAEINAEIDSVNNELVLYFTSNMNWAFNLVAEVEYSVK